MRKIQGQVIRIICALILGQMASRTIRQHAILPADNSFVTGFTLDGGVGANQREEILMVANLLLGSKPALDDMALGAIGAEFTQMNVGVAIRAISPDFGENHVRVALLAGKSPVASPERITGFIVVECKNCPNGSPGGGNVATVARNLKRAVRVRRRRPLLSGGAYGKPRKK